MRGTSLVFMFSIFAAFLGYIIRIVLARTLQPLEYGLFFAVFTFVSIIVIFRDLGMEGALVRFIPQFVAKKDWNSVKTSIVSTLLFNLVGGIVLLLVFILLAPWLATNYFRDSDATKLLIFFGIFQLASVSREILRNSFQGFQKIFLFSLMYLLENGLVLGFLFVLVSLTTLTATSVVIAYIISYFILTLLFLPSFLRASHLLSAKVVALKQQLRNLLTFGFFVTVGGLGSTIILYMDTLILTQSRSLTEVGIYNAVVPTVMVLTFFASSAVQVALPLFSELWAKKQKAYLCDGIRLLHKYFFVLVLPITLIIVSFPEQLLVLLFGKEYSSGAVTLQILAIATLFIMMYTINSFIFLVIGKPRIGAKIIAVGAMLNVVLNILIIPSFGMMGAAATSLLSYFVVFVWSSRELTRLINIRIPWAQWLKNILTGLLFFATLILVKSMIASSWYVQITVGTMVAGIVYLVSSYALKIIDLQEIKQILHLTFRREK